MKVFRLYIFLLITLACSSCKENSTSVQPPIQKRVINYTQEQINSNPDIKRLVDILQDTSPNTQYSPYEATSRTDTTISKEIENQLIEQGKAMFSHFQAYDLEALDAYAPTIEEMAAYYKVFNLNAFQIKFSAFQKNYEYDQLNFGDNLKYDQDLLRRTARGALLRAKSLCLTKERVQIADKVEVNKVYIKPSKRHNDMYDIHIRFKKKDAEEYYEIVNEACWLTDRTCINTQSWKFLGKYNIYSGKYTDSQLNERQNWLKYTQLNLN